MFIFMDDSRDEEICLADSRRLFLLTVLIFRSIGDLECPLYERSPFVLLNLFNIVMVFRRQFGPEPLVVSSRYSIGIHTLLVYRPILYTSNGYRSSNDLLEGHDGVIRFNLKLRYHYEQ